MLCVTYQLLRIINISKFTFKLTNLESFYIRKNNISEFTGSISKSLTKANALVTVREFVKQ